MMAGAATERWSRRIIVSLAGVFLAGIVVRLLLLPTDGYRPDLDQFADWIHGIASGGLPNAYDQQLPFPPVMAYLWGAMAAVEPAFRSATDASDVSMRIVMKIPASLADLAIAVLVVYTLVDRPRWAVGGAAVILLHPAVIDVSAWWGQYESIYVLPGLAAAILAVKGRNDWAAIAVAVSIMTKPQALPLLVPFAAWFLATGGWRGFLRAGMIGTGVVALLWLPFAAANGPANYLAGVADYEATSFNQASLGAWNLWWLVQILGAPGKIVPDDLAVVGPITARLVGIVLAGWLELAIARRILVDPRARTLYLGLAASVLVAFAFLTTMHERYAYAAVVFLVPLLADRRLRLLGLVLGVTFTLNLVALVPPTHEVADVLSNAIPLGVAGSLAILAVTAYLMSILTTRSTAHVGA